MKSLNKMKSFEKTRNSSLPNKTSTRFSYPLTTEFKKPEKEVRKSTFLGSTPALFDRDDRSSKHYNRIASSVAPKSTFHNSVVSTKTRLNDNLVNLLENSHFLSSHMRNHVTQCCLKANLIKKQDDNRKYYDKSLNWIRMKQENINILKEEYNQIVSHEVCYVVQ